MKLWTKAKKCDLCHAKNKCQNCGSLDMYGNGWYCRTHTCRVCGHAQEPTYGIVDFCGEVFGVIAFVILIPVLMLWVWILKKVKE